MTSRQVKEAFEKERPELFAMGMRLSGAMPRKKSKEDLERGIGKKSVGQDQEINPTDHYFFASRPFVFDTRKAITEFRGFPVYMTVPAGDDLPEFFQGRDLGTMPYDECFSKERVIEYAEKHALEICEELNDYTFTLKDICDMIVGRDFDVHVKEIEEERMDRLMNPDKWEEEPDWDDEDEEDEEEEKI